MNAGQMLATLERVEVSADRAPDCRRIIGQERIALADALRSQDPQRIAAAMAEARRVAQMWGVQLGE